MTKIGRNERCPCGSGRKYKRCHGDPGQVDRVNRALEARQIALRRHQAAEVQRKTQQGLGRPIISTEFAGHRLVATKNRVFYGRTWKTFPDFLMHYLGEVLGKELGNSELAKPEPEMHPVALWHRKVCALQAAHQKTPGEIFDSPETGAARAYLDLAYNLYLLEQNAEVRKILLKRLTNPEQFWGALSELRVAGMLVRAGFSMKFEDEGDSSATHCEYTATRAETGKAFSVEVKTRHWPVYPRDTAEGREAVRKHVTRLMRDALEKDVAHERLVIIELAMPDQAPEDQTPIEPWWLQCAQEGIQDVASLFIRQGKVVPPVRAIVCNHPWHLHLDGTRCVTGYVFEGIGPNDFRGSQRGSIREAARHRERHKDFLALWRSIETHRHLPQTFDGSSQHLAHGDHLPRLLVGNRYEVPNQSGRLVNGVLEQAVASPADRQVVGIYLTDEGDRIIVQTPMTDAEIKAYQEHPDTFFGVVQKTGSITDPVDLYLWFLDSYKNSPKDNLLKLMAGRSDIEALRALPQDELAEIYCESLAYHAMMRAEEPKRRGGSSSGQTPGA